MNLDRRSRWSERQRVEDKRTSDWLDKLVEEATKPTRQARWDADHMKTVSCRIRREKAEEFKKLCEDNGITRHTALKNFIFAMLEESGR